MICPACLGKGFPRKVGVMDTYDERDPFGSSERYATTCPACNGEGSIEKKRVGTGPKERGRN